MNVKCKDGISNLSSVSKISHENESLSQMCCVGVGSGGWGW